MNQLERNLQSIEIVKTRLNHEKKINRRAIKLASFAGFVTGIIFTFLFPYLSKAMSCLFESIPFLSSHSDISGLSLALTVMDLCIMISAYTVYDITLAAADNIQKQVL